MANHVNSDTVSDDGSWSDIYNGTKPQIAVLERVNLGETSRDDAAAQSEKMAGDIRAEVAEQGGGTVAHIEQDNDTIMVDHRSAYRDQIDDTVASLQDPAPQTRVDQAVVNGTPAMRTTTSTTNQAQTPATVSMLTQNAPTQNLNVSAHDPSAQLLQPITQVQITTESEDAEVEFDSDYTSSSDDTDDSDESDEDEDDHVPLSAEELEKFLRIGDAQGEDSEAKNAKAEETSYRPRTVNEVEEEVPPRPDITITPQMALHSLGTIVAMVEGSIVIRGVISGHHSVLEPGSLACTTDRKVIGIIADTFGRVEEPMYTILLGHDLAKLVEELKLSVNSTVLYSQDHSKFAMTRILQMEKGTDASNIHDEEVAVDDQDFSDDEKEAAYKRERNQAKKGGKTISRSEWLEKHNDQLIRRSDREGPSTQLHPDPVHLSQRHASARSTANRAAPSRPTLERVRNNIDAPEPSTQVSLNYDDDDDEPYQPLKRPDNYAEAVQAAHTHQQPPWQHRNDRHRGSRGRGRPGQREHGEHYGARATEPQMMTTHHQAQPVNASWASSIQNSSATSFTPSQHFSTAFMHPTAPNTNAGIHTSLQNAAAGYNNNNTTHYTQPQMASWPQGQWTLQQPGMYQFGVPPPYVPPAQLAQWWATQYGAQNQQSSNNHPQGNGSHNQS